MQDMTILFVDDERETLDSLKRSLIREPYRKLFALSGSEALDMIAQQDVHVIVSDFTMPEMDGLTLLNEVRRRQPQIVRLVLSGTSDMEQIVGMINSGEIYRYVTKPVYMVKELRATLQQAIELYQIKQSRIALQQELETRNRELRQWQDTIQRELNLAGALQRKILSTDPFLHAHFEVYSAYEPHISVGGDFFDMVSLPASAACVFIGDVAGHGVAPAMISVLLKVLIEETVYSMYDQGPAAVCNVIHQRFLQYVNHAESYATLFLALYNADTRTWRGMNCGHPPPLIQPFPEGLDLNRGGFPVGLSIAPDTICTPEDELVIPGLPELKMVFYTDGLTEARPTRSELICNETGLNDVAPLIHDPLVLNPARKILDRFQQRGCDMSQDDCSLLVIQTVNPETCIWENDLQQDKQAVYDCAKACQERLQARDWPQPAAWSVRMVVHEYAMNIIDHAQLPASASFHLRLRVEGEMARILFLDSGREWDYAARKGFLEHRAIDAERGRGLEIIGTLCRDIMIFRRGSVNHAFFTVLKA